MGKKKGHHKKEEEHEQSGNIKPSFFKGPFFRVIPAKKEVEAQAAAAALEKAAPEAAPSKAHGLFSCLPKRKKHEPEEVDYLSALKHNILVKPDQDGVYGLTDDELVPLPFDAPRLWRYITEFALGVYQVAQSTVVMYIAILIDNDARAALLGPSYGKYKTLIKVVISLYPLVTLVCLTMIISEQLMRKFMYYRLLSMRILVDWENRKIYKSWFFYYFLATWVLLNVWSIWGVAKFAGMGQRSSADTVSFAAFVVVNLQTVQLLLQYQKIMTTEKRLVALNAIFERAPLEAQMLLTYTYVIEEHVLLQECRNFGRHAVRAFRKRLFNLLTCGTTNRKWHKEAVAVRFELENLKRGAANYDEVEDKVGHLRQQMAEEAALTGQAPTVVGLDKGVAPEGVELQAPRSKPGAEGAALALTAHATLPGQGPPAAAAAAAAGDVDPERGAPPPAGQAATGVAAGGRNQLGVMAGAAATTAAQYGTVALDLVEAGVEFLLYRSWYGTVHALFIATMPTFPTWPYKRDLNYFRVLLLIEILGLCSVAVIVVFGLMRATAASQCSSATKVCDNCFTATQQLEGLTCSTGYNITRVEL